MGEVLMQRNLIPQSAPSPSTPYEQLPVWGASNITSPQHSSKCDQALSISFRLDHGEAKVLSHVRLFVTHGLLPVRLLCPWNSPCQNRSGLPFPSPRDLPNPGIKLRSPPLHADSSPSEPPGKPKNTGVGSLSLLHGFGLS